MFGVRRLQWQWLSMPLFVFSSWLLPLFPPSKLLSLHSSFVFDFLSTSLIYILHHWIKVMLEGVFCCCRQCSLLAHRSLSSKTSIFFSINNICCLAVSCSVFFSGFIDSCNILNNSFLLKPASLCYKKSFQLKHHIHMHRWISDTHDYLLLLLLKSPLISA